MAARSPAGRWVLLVLVAGCVTAALPARGYAQRGPSNRSAGTHAYGQGDGKDAKTTLAEPYGGQLFCPVTGTKLGLTQPAVPVQTSIGEQKPAPLSKLFGAKPQPGAVIYVCCPECAEKVRHDPETYLRVVIQDKSVFAGCYTYATAPDHRPDTRKPHSRGVDASNTAASPPVEPNSPAAGKP